MVRLVTKLLFPCVSTALCSTANFQLCSNGGKSEKGISSALRNLGYAVLGEQHLEALGNHPQLKGRAGLKIVSHQCSPKMQVSFLSPQRSS